MHVYCSCKTEVSTRYEVIVLTKQGVYSSKKAIRLISNSSYICHTNPLFIKLKKLKVGDIFKLKLLKLYYKLSHILLPSYFDRYRDIIEQNPGRVVRINFIYSPLIKRVYAECSPLFNLS